MRRAMAVTAAIGAVVLASACTDAGGEAQPSPQGSSDAAVPSSGAAGSNPPESGQELPHSGAPAVSDPLPESVLSGDPCEAFTQEQLDQFLGTGVPEGERADLEQVGNGCDWSSAQTTAGMQIGFATVDGEGLSAEYANTQPQSGHFEEVEPIDGFPAVEHQIVPGGAECTVAVGLADEYSVTVHVGSSVDAQDRGVDSCDSAAEAAGVLVENLKKQA